MIALWAVAKASCCVLGAEGGLKLPDTSLNQLTLIYWGEPFRVIGLMTSCIYPRLE